MVTRADIYDYAASALDTAVHAEGILEENEELYCSARLEAIPESFPAVYIVCINEAAVSRNYTFDFTDETARFQMEVHVFSNLVNGGLTQAESIMQCVRQIFRGAYFFEGFVGRTDNIDPTIIHLVGRFYRIFGGGDKLPGEE